MIIEVFNVTSHRNNRDTYNAADCREKWKEEKEKERL